MATYCAKFIPNFRDVSEPLRKLTKKDQPFHWEAEHSQSFNTIKELLTSAETMAYFDSSKETELLTDASPSGLSAILIQHTPGKDDKLLKPSPNSSRAAEREALAIVWAIERLHLYLFGQVISKSADRHFKLLTDCKPVELILNNPKSKPPPFNSEDIRKYMAENGINHSRITLLWPQANSEAENFMMKAIRSAHAEGKTWKKHLYKFLLNYRTTPHCTTGFAPA